MNPKIEQTEHVWLQNVLTGIFLRGELLATDDPKRHAKAEHLATRTVQHFLRQRRDFTLDDAQRILRDDHAQSDSGTQGMFRSALFEPPFGGKTQSVLIAKCTKLLLDELPDLQRPSPEAMQTLLPPTDPLETPSPEQEQSVQSKVEDKPTTYTRGQVQHAVYRFFLQHPDVPSERLNAHNSQQLVKDRALLLTTKVMENLTFEHREGVDVIVDGLKKVESAVAKQIQDIIKADPAWPTPQTTPRGIANSMARHLGKSTPPLLMEAKSVSAAGIMELNQKVNALRNALAAQDEGRGAA